MLIKNIARNMLLNSKSISDRLKYVLAKFTTWPGLKSAYLPVESSTGVLFSKYIE